jgi:hypothetical protein
MGGQENTEKRQETEDRRKPSGGGSMAIRCIEGGWRNHYSHRRWPTEGEMEAAEQILHRMRAFLLTVQRIDHAARRGWNLKECREALLRCWSHIEIPRFTAFRVYQKPRPAHAKLSSGFYIGANPAEWVSLSTFLKNILANLDKRMIFASVMENNDKEIELDDYHHGEQTCQSQWEIGPTTCGRGFL